MHTAAGVEAAHTRDNAAAEGISLCPPLGRGYVPENAHKVNLPVVALVVESTESPAASGQAVGRMVSAVN